MPTPVLPRDAAELAPGDLLTPEEVASILRTSLSTLANWRSLKQGPRYRKVGGRMVRYFRSDIRAFIADDTIDSVGGEL